MLLLALLGGPGCAEPYLKETRARMKSGATLLSTDQLRASRASLLQVLPQAEEKFPDFLPRARAALLTADDPEIQALAFEVPDVLRARPAPAVKQVLPVLMARWAAVHRADVRINLLRSALKMDTARRRQLGEAAPGFETAQAMLKVLAESPGLRLLVHPEGVWELTTRTPGQDGRQDDVVLVTNLDTPPIDAKAWKHAPYNGHLERGRMYGPGAAAGKGATLAAAFALLALAEAKLPAEGHASVWVSTHRFRGGAAVAKLYERLRKRGTEPKHLVLAAGSFPALVGEKGALTLRAEAPAYAPDAAPATTAALQLVAIDGGQELDHVPERARATFLPLPDHAVGPTLGALRARASTRGWPKVDVALEDGKLIIEAQGRPAPAQDPWPGRNAIADLNAFVLAHTDLLATPCVGLLTVLHRRLGTSFAAEALDVPDEAEGFSRATATLTRVRSTEGAGCEAYLDVRWPPPRSSGDVAASVKRVLLTDLALLETGAVQIEVTAVGREPWLTDAQGDLLPTLVNAHHVVTGLTAATQTGATPVWAQEVGGRVVFGPLPAGEPSREGPDEYLTVEEHHALTEIYAFALATMAL